MRYNSEGTNRYLSTLTDAYAISVLNSVEYLDAYRALLLFAQSVKDDDRHDGLLSLAFAAYGWMPTILGQCDMALFKSQKPICEIRALDNKCEARKFLVSMGDKAPINGSWVGTSKVMHFLNPKLFPIWDSRVAKNFDLRWPYQINSKRNYLCYFDFVHIEILKDHSWFAVVEKEINEKYDYSPTLVRCLELMLFARERGASQIAPR
ncbi:hypothetical protein [Celeribacter halophilus]|uniref:hypothetical protein n=1 Tax=Celeribacter halophilus TaxID=576117 RepID=UPI001C093D78|nr:hypothetical protein [Celeribacter halophilus]MBU2889858.1 hypothetical protein [Celeribacter halophilus]MDO6512448.1 hypothetical protein [Celeribacter halophilus]